MELEFSREIFEKYSNIIFHEKSIELEPSCSMQTGGRTDMTKLIVAFRNFTKAPNNNLFGLSGYLSITRSHNLYLKHDNWGWT